MTHSSRWRTKKAFTYSVAAACMFFALASVSGQGAAKSPVALYNEAQTAIDGEDPHHAIELLKEAVALNPRYADALISLAEVYYYLDEYDESLRFIGQAQALARTDSRLQNVQARVLLALGRSSEASALFKIVLSREPYNVDALLGLAEFSLSGGDALGALQQYQKTLKYRAKDKRILLALALIYEERGDKASSEKYVLQALDAWPESPLVQALSSEYYLRQSQKVSGAERLTILKTAEYHAQTALSLSSNYERALEDLGTVYLQMGDFNKSLAVADTLVGTVNGDNAQAHYIRGISLVNLNNSADAISAFDRALLIHPGDEITRIILEDILVASTGEKDPKRTKYAAFHLELAKSLRKKNLNERAAVEYRRAMQIAPQDTDVLQSYADFLKATSQFASFVGVLQRLSSLGIKNNFVTDNLEIYQSLLQSSLSKSQNIDQYNLPRDAIVARLYWLPGSLRLDHPLAEPYLASYVQKFITDWRVLTFSGSKKELTDVVQPQFVSSSTDAFRKSREENVDYYFQLNCTDSGDNFQSSLDLYLARTGTKLGTYQIYKTGNDRVVTAVSQLNGALKADLPVRGRLYQRELGTGIINLGKIDGLKVGDVLNIVDPAAVILRGDKTGFSFSNDGKTGLFTVTTLDDAIAEGTVTRSGFFDKININDLVLKQTESAAKTTEASASFPYLYNKIRGIH